LNLNIKFENSLLNKYSAMKKFTPLLALMVLVGFAMFMGQSNQFNKDEAKWNKDPRMTQIVPTGEYVPPVVTSENFARTFNGPVTYSTPAGTLTVNPNVRVHPSSNTQSEVPITRHPINQSILYGSSNAVSPSVSFISEGCYVSTNGGATWFGSDTTASAPISNHGGDPAPAVGPNGYFYMSQLGYSTSGIFAEYSTNYGATWSNTYTIVSGSQDKNHTFVNDVSTSPYYGRVFVTWSLFTASAPPCVVSYSTNNGVSYTTYKTPITPASGHYHQGVNGATMPNGDAIICFQNPITGSPYTGDYVGFVKSTDGGDTWTGVNNAYDCNGIRGNLFASGIRVNDFPWMGVDRTGGPRNGYIYITTAEKGLSPAGSDPDIILHYSSNGGTNWSAGIRVNQDALNNGKYQYMPALRVDEYGGVNVIYYDTRNCTGDSAEVYVSRSIDGGLTWTDILVSDHRFKPKPISGLAGGYQGDYIGITSGNNKVYPYWCDDKTGLYQAWITTIDLGPAINHTPLTNTEQISGNRAVNCTITPAGSGINPSTVKLYYAKNNTTFSAVAMTNSSGTNWTANLPLTGAGTYNYYLTATDSMSRSATAPSGAPGIYYSFIAATDTVKPVITHTPLTNTPKIQWPATVTATVTDNIGVDSVWVKWRKNSTTTKMFKLLNTGGTNYAAAFNSDTSQVAVGDTIYYRVFARDISSMHNADSTAQYSFTIINQANIIVGTGTTSSNFPFTTYWMDGRTNYLYFASELQVGPASIAAIGFNVITADPAPINEFTIKMQNTTATSISGFTADGWTTCYSQTYTLPGTGWQMINLTTPFQYTGGNLLVEICYNNSSYTAFSPVYCSSTTGDYWGRYNDLSTASGCGYTAWTMTTGPVGKANTRFTMNPGTAVTPIGTATVPQSYSLAQNYPNPFNPVTKINFAIPKQGFVTLKVYDMLGREVTKLVNEVKQAGTYSVDFDATRLSSGVYFYKLEAGSFVDTKRMVLVK
jgi:hypothetical protein